MIEWLKSLLCVIEEMGAAEWAAWIQAIGALLAIYASGWVARSQAKAQHDIGLKLQKEDQLQKQIAFAEAITEIVRNAKARIDFVCKSFPDRQSVYDVAMKSTYYDYDGLSEIEDSLKQIALHELTSSKLVRSLMLMIPTVRQMNIQVNKAINEHSSMDAIAYQKFFNALNEMAKSAEKRCLETSSFLESLRSKASRD